MKKHFKNALSDTDWLVTESSRDPDQRSLQESLFALGNGYMGSRAIYEEMPKQSSPGTYFAGVFDAIGSKVAELVNAPNPFQLKISIADGEKLNIDTMDVLKHQRTLNLKKGVLARQTRYKHYDQQRYDYQSMRFISMDNPHIAVMKVAFTPLDQPVRISVDSVVDLGVRNQGPLKEGDTCHFHIQALTHKDSVTAIELHTLDHKTDIVYADQMFITHRGNEQKVSAKRFDIDLKKGETLVITKYFAFETSRDISKKSDLKPHTLSLLRKAVRQGFDELYERHCDAFKQRWEMSDITIEGSDKTQAGLRLNIYHLLIAFNSTVQDASIGAKTLTGEGYKGHVFWDTEIFALPFYAMTDPKSARNLLAYRFARLHSAQEIAKQYGYQGAMFPWESADTGEDETPTWAKGRDGSINIIRTGNQEHHITADIFYALYNYYQITHDDDFMLSMGISMAVEIAKFWASRVTFKPRTNQYEIKDIMGPDEFHYGVDNNAFTNMLVKWTFENTLNVLQTFESSYPKEMKRLLAKHQINTRKKNRWQHIADHIKLPYTPRSKLLLQFDRYLELKKTKPLTLKQNSLPAMPEKLGMKGLRQTQYLKQSDVVMLLHLLPEEFSNEAMQKHYAFYEPKTLHKSSLSVPIHAAVAASIGRSREALRFFNLALNTDEKNVYENSSSGIHLSGIGGSWLACVYGFCGIRIIDDILTVSPRIPARWQTVSLSICYRGLHLKFSLNQKHVDLEVLASPYKQYRKALNNKTSNKAEIIVYDQAYIIKKGERYSFTEENK